MASAAAARPKLRPVPAASQPRPNGEVGRRTHHQLARLLREDLTHECGGIEPVYDDGSMWLCKNGLWRSMALDELMVMVGELPDDEKHCRKVSDYRAVSEQAQRLSAQAAFFADAPAGVATARGFYRVTADGIDCVPLTPEHRARFALAADPDVQFPAPLFARFLDLAFAGAGGEVERRRFQEVAGGALTGQIAKHQKAVLLYGPAATAKSTAANLVAGLLPPEFVCATSPHRWDSEYYIATLAGKRLNEVGELSQSEPIPAADFKRVIGGDRLQGRHPNHRPIEFYNTASHLFVSNHLPSTEDRGEGFFRRWEILPFLNPVPREEIIPELAARILDEELPALLAFALDGALRLAQQGKFTPSAAHERLLLRWRLSASSVLEFLHDPAACVLEPSASIPQAELFAAYQRWSDAAGRRKVGRNSFYQDVDENGGVAGVRRVRNNGTDIIRGVRLAMLGEIRDVQ